MLINDDFQFSRLKDHMGHKIVCVPYSKVGEDDPWSMNIECEDCCEVLVSVEREEEEEQ